MGNIRIEESAKETEADDSESRRVREGEVKQSLMVCRNHSCMSWL